ncbi:Protein of unknown function [Pustulibacterium marinum]|uniref:DUF2971 domain-containing protein n=1 Tax=Pustulibacterium marinum TaxID=1224947 RepID=A0A1I7IZT6_9FLAO|nr:DUF2971 domain-containing protein [Pustulibacterium marinum]SFU78459.1 Protein of unknown function [Pustulibacterium marinum]
MDSVYEMEKMREKFPIEMGRPFVFRFRPPNQNTLSELENGYIWFSDRSSLNDPLDSNPEFVKLSNDPEELQLLYKMVSDGILDKSTKKYFEENMSPIILNEFAKTKVAPFVDSFGIACFTMYPMNEELWKIYASNHKGICLQFDINKDIVFFDNLLPVQYVPKILERTYNPISEPNHIVDLFYKKTEEWSYEKELRLLKPTIGRERFKSKALQSIIIGDQAEPAFIQQIMEIVKKKYPGITVYQTLYPVKISDFKCRLIYGTI